jgi:hypothetical protein
MVFYCFMAVCFLFIKRFLLLQTDGKLIFMTIEGDVWQGTPYLVDIDIRQQLVAEFKRYQCFAFFSSLFWIIKINITFIHSNSCSSLEESSFGVCVCVFFRR